MTTIDLQGLLSQLDAHRSRFEAGLAALDERISATQDLIDLLETPLPVPPDPVPSVSDPPSQPGRAKRSSSSARGPQSSDHHAVRALRADDLRPYQRFKDDLQSLAVRYAELHDGEIDMKGLVPLSVRLGISKAEYYKNAWGGVYRALQRNSRFIPVMPPGKGKFRIGPVPDDPAEADAA